MATMATMDDNDIETLCDLFGSVSHHEDDHVTYCDCGVQACISCIVRVQECTGEHYVCKECADERAIRTAGASTAQGEGCNA